MRKCAHFSALTRPYLPNPEINVAMLILAAKRFEEGLLTGSVSSVLVVVTSAVWWKKCSSEYKCSNDEVIEVPPQAEALG